MPLICLTMRWEEPPSTRQRTPYVWDSFDQDGERGAGDAKPIVRTGRHLPDPNEAQDSLVGLDAADENVALPVADVARFGERQVDVEEILYTSDAYLRVLPARMRNAVGHRAYRLGGRVGAGVDLREGRLGVPGHPVGGVRADRRGMALESDEVFKRGDLVQLGGVDEAHENIADARAVEGAVKEGIFPMQEAHD